MNQKTYNRSDLHIVEVRTFLGFFPQGALWEFSHYAMIEQKAEIGIDVFNHTVYTCILPDKKPGFYQHAGLKEGDVRIFPSGFDEELAILKPSGIKMKSLEKVIRKSSLTFPYAISDKCKILKR